MSEISQIITDTRAYSCLDCGKCTAACPISQYDSEYSPRKVVYNALSGHEPELLRNGQLWSCLTCSMCEERCQSGVRYTELIKLLRAKAHGLGETGQCTHGGALQSLMHIMTADHLSQNRLGWLNKNLKTATESDVLYFVGCQPYFDVIFSDIGVRTLDTARGAVKLLNRLDIVPVLLPNERCCGHDLLWAGDTAHFTRLAEHNLMEISKARAKQVVTTCPECYLTLKVEYPRYFGNLDFEVVHMSQLLSKGVADGALKFHRSVKKVTYHDPCRLGRFSGIYDEPRTVIDAIPGVELLEMVRSRTSALCCGTQAWMNCGTINKQIQSERLREASATGADALLTSCPKCQIHLRCAMHDENLREELKLEIEDVASLAAKALTG
ncbi:(Fe-S)-binding protein [Chloroflexota bacterium]